MHNSDCTPPNFQTALSATALLRGFQKTLASIYDPAAFYERAWQSLQHWKSHKTQRPSHQPGMAGIVRIMLHSIWHQGIRSSYRAAYWKYLFRMVSRYPFDRAKLWLGTTILISGHHFIPYAREVVERAEAQILKTVEEPELVGAGKTSS